MSALEHAPRQDGEHEENEGVRLDGAQLEPEEMAVAARRRAALREATEALGEGRVIVMPTDTVYGVGADPFNPDGVAGLLAAKGRGREKPPAVLVPSAETVDGLAMNVPSYARRLMERFWPGGLTLIFRAQPSLMWDLGDTNGTVGLRVPDDEIALELLRSSGPMAVSSATQVLPIWLTSGSDDPA